MGGLSCRLSSRLFGSAFCVMCWLLLTSESRHNTPKVLSCFFWDRFYRCGSDIQYWKKGSWLVWCCHSERWDKNPLVSIVVVAWWSRRKCTTDSHDSVGKFNFRQRTMDRSNRMSKHVWILWDSILLMIEFFFDFRTKWTCINGRLRTNWQAWWKSHKKSFNRSNILHYYNCCAHFSHIFHNPQHQKKFNKQDYFVNKNGICQLHPWIACWFKWERNPPSMNPRNRS